MRSTFLRVAALLGVAAWTIECGAQESAPGSRNAPSAPADAGRRDDIYHGLRGLVLSLDRESAGESSGSGPYAAMMEMGLSQGTATLAAVDDGTVSLYFSSGSGILGAGQKYADVRARGEAFLHAAGSAAERLEPATEHPVPSPGHVRFYLIGADGVRTAEVPIGELVSGRHALASLFESGQAVITAVRGHSEVRPKERE